MLQWFKAGYFTMGLLVRRVCDEIFLPLGKRFFYLKSQKSAAELFRIFVEFYTSKKYTSYFHKIYFIRLFDIKSHPFVCRKLTSHHEMLNISLQSCKNLVRPVLVSSKNTYIFLYIICFCFRRSYKTVEQSALSTRP